MLQMGHYVVNVSEPQLQTKCLTAQGGSPLKKVSTEFFLAYLFSPMNTLIQNLGKFCGPDPLLMENWGHPCRTTDLCPLPIWLTQNQIKWFFFKDVAEKTGNDLLSLTTNSILLSFFSVKHPPKTWCPTGGQRKEVLSQQTFWRPATASPSPRVDLQLLAVQLRAGFRLSSHKKHSAGCFSSIQKPS